MSMKDSRKNFNQAFTYRYTVPVTTTRTNIPKFKTSFFIINIVKSHKKQNFVLKFLKKLQFVFCRLFQIKVQNLFSINIF